ncbi:helix-turn-helix domain-containing protein [Streptomyces sp. NPDC057430]|uniref:helix-turn-helix domain-containing protein n=1 Tax=Streptomyces sp. NPDC057430 TaxID=3346131 RepID=UPI0036C479D8
MTQQPRPRTQITDPTGRTVASNLRRVRELRGLSTYDLSRALGSAGRPIAPSALAKIERCERRVDVGDLMMLADVLKVSPLALLLPTKAYGTTVIELTEQTSATLDDAWDWGAGLSALPDAPGGTVAAEQQADFQRLGLPESRRLIAQHPAGQALRDAVKAVNRLILGADVYQFPDTFDADVEYAKSALTRVNAEVDHLKLTHERFLERKRRIEEREAEEHRAAHPWHDHGSDGEGDGG